MAHISIQTDLFCVLYVSQISEQEHAPVLWQMQTVVSPAKLKQLFAQWSNASSFQLLTIHKAYSKQWFCNLSAEKQITKSYALTGKHSDPPAQLRNTDESKQSSGASGLAELSAGTQGGEASSRVTICQSLKSLRPFANQLSVPQHFLIKALVNSWNLTRLPVFCIPTVTSIHSNFLHICTHTGGMMPWHICRLHCWS